MSAACEGSFGSGLVVGALAFGPFVLAGIGACVLKIDGYWRPHERAERRRCRELEQRQVELISLGIPQKEAAEIIEKQMQREATEAMEALTKIIA